MEAVQKKMNIYGRYLPLIAQFSTELAGKKDPPRYKLLMEERGEATSEPQGGQAEGTGETTDVTQEKENVNQEEEGQETIDKYGGS